MADFITYEQRAKAWLESAGASLEGKRLELTELSQALYHRTVTPFRFLIADPIGPNYLNRDPLDTDHRDRSSHKADLDQMMKDGPALGGECGIVAIGVHGAGDYLPYGRHSDIVVSEAAVSGTLVEARFTGKADQTHCEAFLSLFNEVYKRFMGRQHTLIHSLLHGIGGGDGQIIEISFGEETQSTPSAPPSASDDAYLPIRCLPMEGILRFVADADAHRRFVEGVGDQLKQLVDVLRANERGTGSRMSAFGEPVALFAERVVAALRAEECDNPGDPHRGFCFTHTFQRNVLMASAHLEEERSRSVGAPQADRSQQLCDMVLSHRRGDNDPHGLSERIKATVEVIHLFLLYRKLCGEWFYVVVPKNQDHLRMCFTVGTMRRLDTEMLNGIARVACTTRKTIDKFLAAAHTSRVRKWGLEGQWRDLKTHIGDANVTALEGMGLGAPSLGSCVAGGLVWYLRFCERISEVAVHEGRKLHFDVIISDGIYASEHLARVSRLGRDDRVPWIVDRACGTIDSALDPEEVISRLLGNQSFLQGPGMVLLGNREGRLLNLAKVLGGRMDPEALTKSGTVIVQDETLYRCYLLQVRERGDICVFFGGKMVLWRRAGEYIVPLKYGEDYCNQLRSALEDSFDAHDRKNVDFDVLTRAVWQMSSSGKGCSFVLGRLSSVIGGGKDRPRTFMDENTYELTDVFPHAESLPLVGKGGLELLKDLASQDGGVLIDMPSGLVYGRRQLRPRKVFDWRDHVEEWESSGDSRWKDWDKVFRWGTRHHSALAFSATAGKPGGKPVAVITVSSDGDIHCFRGNRPDSSLTYPQPQPQKG